MFLSHPRRSILPGITITMLILLFPCFSFAQEDFVGLAQKEHDTLFAGHPSILLIDPDCYLYSKTFDSERALSDIKATLTARSILITKTQEKSLRDAVDTVRATTQFLGPATIHVEGLSDTGGKAVVLVVSYDSARPFQIAVHSLANISDPTVLLFPQMRFSEFQCFTRYHESAHAFQHLNGAHHHDVSDNAYLHGIEEAEADAFAVLAWYKFKEADSRVPEIWFGLRLSCYVEKLCDKRFDAAMEYFTHTSVAHAIAEAKRLHGAGMLQEMNGDELFQAAQSIVKRSVPDREQLALDGKLLAEKLATIGNVSLRERLSLIASSTGSDDSPASRTLRQYRDSITGLLQQRGNQENEESPREAALRMWQAQLRRDLKRTQAKALVLDRLQEQLAAESLHLAFSSASSEAKKAIKTHGREEVPFVPLDQKYALLKQLRSEQ